MVLWFYVRLCDSMVLRILRSLLIPWALWKNNDCVQSSVSADSVDSSDYGCLCDFVIRLSQRYEFTAAGLFADSVTLWILWIRWFYGFCEFWGVWAIA
mgnify:CR=1 FL=1